jgi:hypothetical protein
VIFLPLIALPLASLSVKDTFLVLAFTLNVFALKTALVACLFTVTLTDLNADL